MAAPKGNKNALGNDGGRPALFNSPDELQLKVDEYFNGGANTRVINGIITPIYTISGLAYFLGFSARQSFYDYGNRVEYSDIIKKARLRIEINYEESLMDKTYAGSIFALKNMGWSDKTEIDHTVNIPTLPDIIIK